MTSSGLPGCSSNKKTVLSPVDVCKDVDCSGHGTCVAVRGDPDYAQCMCDTGFQNGTKTTCLPAGCWTCDDLEAECGTPSDNCGKTLDCGTCSDGQTCDGNLHCRTCQPRTCGDACGTVSDGCGGTLDCGQCQACQCERWAGTYSTIDLPRGVIAADQEAFDGEDTIGFLYDADDSDTKTASVMLQFIHADGSASGSVELVSAQYPGVGPQGIVHSGNIAFGNDRFVATWTQIVDASQETLHVGAYGKDGSVLADPVQVLSADSLRPAGVAVLGKDTYVLYRTDALYAQRFDASLAPQGEPIEIPGIDPPGPLPLYQVRTLDDTVAIVGAGAPGTTVRVVLLRDGQIVGTSDLDQISSSSAGQTVGHLSAATDGSGNALVCYHRDFSPISCRHFSLADATPTGAAFKLSPDDQGRAWDLVYAGCAYQVPMGVATGSGAQAKFLAYEIDADDNITVTTMDRQWVQATQNFAAFETKTNGLLRISGPIIALEKCAPALPEPDCTKLQADITAQACEECGDDPNTCCVGRGDGNYSCNPKSNYRPPDCNSIDTVACRIAMDQPQQCFDDPYSDYWKIPADCALPR